MDPLQLMPLIRFMKLFFFLMVFVAVLNIMTGCGPATTSTPPGEPSETGCLEQPFVFSGYTFYWKDHGEDLVGPGPNRFSCENVRLDEEGRLHLTIKKRDGKWTCGEVFSEQQGWGYGTFRFSLGSRVDNLDPAAVAGLFTYEGTAPCRQCDLVHCHCREIDVEFCRGWGKGGYFSVQPNRTSGGLREFSFPQDQETSTFQFQWKPGGVVFRGDQGYDTSMLSSTPGLGSDPNRKAGISARCVGFL